MKVKGFLIKFFQYGLGVILAIPVGIFSLLWVVLRIFWLYAGLTILFSLIILEVNPEMSEQEAFGYGGSMSLLWGIISKIKDLRKKG